MSRPSPAIAVAIPAYNREQYLEETLQSVLAQTYPPAEIFVCDDGSTDDTVSVLRKYSGRIGWKTIQNSGPAAARSVAIDATSSPWIALCDSDDLWEPDHLERKVALLTRWPEVNFVFSNSCNFGVGVNDIPSKFERAPEKWWDQFQSPLADGFQLLETNAYGPLLRFMPALVPGQLFKRDLYDAVGGISPRVSRLPSEDAHLTRRLAAIGHVAVDWKISCRIRKHEGNFSSSDIANMEGRIRILRLLLGDPLLTEGQKAMTAAEIKRSLKSLFASYIFVRRFDLANALRREHPDIDFGSKSAIAGWIDRFGLGRLFARD